MTIRAFQINEAGEPADFREIDLPSPKPGEVRLNVHSCGLNFADLLIQNGTYQEIPSPPFTLGMEMAGTVSAIGESVDGIKIGDRVAVYAGQGGLAEAANVPADRIVPLPDAMSFDQAAAFLIAYGTSHMALDHRAKLRPGETLLVTGAAGGVGLTAVEIGKLMGARVIAHARGAAKLSVAQAAGADHLIDDTEDLRERVLALGGADVVYDAVGGEAFRAAFRACNPEGRLICIGFASGDIPQIPANHLMVKNLTAIGFYIGGYHTFRADAVRTSFTTLFTWFNEGRLKPHISHVLPLDQVREGFELLRSRKSTGKVVIRVRDPAG
ncbi:MAG: NADPH:quinone oxidoreductase family protein [Arenibacterium sp.]